MTIKEQLKGTCVLNEKEEMGAEIVALYTEAGIENVYDYSGKNLGLFYGERNGCINYGYRESFDKVLTLSQLRDIVKGKQETRFKDLPEILINLLIRNVSGFKWSDNLEGLFAQIDWQKCTNAERLAYCEVRYPKGTKIKSCYGAIDVVVGKPLLFDGLISIDCNGEKDRLIYDRRKFAEIVSTPELEEQIKNAKPAMINSSEGIATPISEPQFKAGDVVKYSDDNENWEQGVYGLMFNRIHFIQSNEYLLEGYNHVRHPKDKIREAAEKSSELQEGSYTPPHKTTYIHGFIDGAKWGQENPK